ncbi:hypothetical protein SSX86_026358 [Deinandra increscens subsp. villosa]|uniref:ENTH domain-containing protein n=1 Tax=Deinandra increscens subsp. villosa TaxID=3103831 RepID=A0AAP0GN03_9ASTR
MSSCLSSRTCGFDLEHMIKWPCSRTPSNPSSPSSTLSESSNSQTTISTQRTRTPRKRPNQTYNEAAALLSIASPNIFKIKHLSRKTTNLPKFTKHHGNFFNEPPELITDDSGFLLRRRFMNNPCFLPELKVANSGRVSGDVESGCGLSEVSDGCLDDFDTGSILNEEIEQGIDSIMGDSKLIPENHELNGKIGSGFNACYGYPIGLGFGVRNGLRALKNADERNWWDFPMVDVVNSSPADVGKCERSPVGKKKKKRVEEFRQGSFSSGDGKRLVLKLDYDGVLSEWADKGLPLPEEISHSSSPGGDIHTMAANIDLFSEDGGWNESTATRPTDKNSPKKTRTLKSTGSDKRSRCKGRFVKKPNSSDCDEVAVKTLMVFHRVLREGDPSFREELLTYSRRQPLFQIREFRDESSQLAWDCSSWIRTYASFLEERLECYRVLGFDIDMERLITAPGVDKAYSRTRVMDINELLDQLPVMQQLLQRLIGCQPEGAACRNGLIQQALALILKESLKIYNVISDGITNLVESFFDLPKDDAINALNIYKKVEKQVENLGEFYNLGKHLRPALNIQFPTLSQPPPSFLAIMEEYIEGSYLNGSVSARNLELQDVIEEPPPREIQEVEIKEVENNLEVKNKEVHQDQEHISKPIQKVEREVLPLITINNDDESRVSAKSAVINDSIASESPLTGWDKDEKTSSWELAVVSLPSTNTTNISQEKSRKRNFLAEIIKSMARLLSQTLIRITSSSSNSLQPFKLGISQPNRFSSRSGKAQLIEVDLESEGEVEVLGLRKLEDVIHNIIVRQSAPDWLPFVPGSSYWVPPQRHRPQSDGLIAVLTNITNPLTEDESMSLSSSRGWPSSAYFIEGTSSVHPVEVKVDKNQDEEG